ncbi:MAG: alpha/beta fold hydrolase [Anaerolineae bacterium]|nr:alpha/beta fold hydrolase [Anaerolineae bacterium]
MSIRIAVVIALIGITLTACDIPAEPETIPVTPSITVIPPSPTTAPLIPTAYNPTGGNVSEQDFTPAAPALSTDNPEITVTPTSAPTEAAILMQFPAGDGVTLVGTYYGAPVRPASTVLLLHDMGSNKEAWGVFAVQLQQSGYNVLTVDLRGTGATGGKVDWSKATQDVAIVLNRLRTLPGVDRRRLSVIGAGIGANLALAACADIPDCKYIVLISPRLDDSGVKIADAMARYGNRAVFMVASRGDVPGGADSIALDKLAQGDHKLQLVEGTARGMALLSTQSGLAGTIIEWMKAHNT